MVKNRNSRQTPLVMKKYTLLSKSWIILGTSYQWTHTLCVFCDWVLLIKKLFSNEFSAHSSDHCTFLHIICPVFLCFVIFPLYMVYMYKLYICQSTRGALGTACRRQSSPPCRFLVLNSGLQAC